MDQAPGSPASASPRTARLVLRISAEQKTLFQRAAALEGRSLTDFVLGSAQAAAEATLHAQPIVLSARDSALLVEALLNPPEANERLRAAVQHHRAVIGE